VRFEKTLYFDPGNKEVQQYVTTVIRDIVRRYDIDALHLDDYFYPYDIVEARPGQGFPDNVSYARYGQGMSKGDWRRSNTDSIIVRSARPSRTKSRIVNSDQPFRYLRNSYKTRKAARPARQTDYDNLYADILLWLKNAGSTMWSADLFRVQPFHAPYAVLLDWWARHTYGRQCFIVWRPTAGSNAAWRDPTQLTRQIQALRSYPRSRSRLLQ